MLDAKRDVRVVSKCALRKQYPVGGDLLDVD